MKLHEKLNSIPNEQIVNEIDKMISNAQVRISFWGERVVTVGGYEGEVPIHDLAEKFLSFKPKELSPSLVDRLARYNLWNKIHELYLQTDEQIKHMCLYKGIVFVREFTIGCPCCRGDTMARIRPSHRDEQDFIFAFNKVEYLRLWPEFTANVTSSDPYIDYLIATKEMVESAIKKQS